MSELRKPVQHENQGKGICRKHPELDIDISECVLCDICVDIAPEIFVKNDSDYIELAEDIEKRLYDDQGNVINPALLEEIQDAIRNCRGDCISWDETTETEHV